MKKQTAPAKKISTGNGSVNVGNRTKDDGMEKSVNNNKSGKKSDKAIKDVFEEELKDIYGAEKQLMKALPEMVKGASSPELIRVFEDHLEETKGQVKRIEKIFAMLSIDREEKKCEAMAGLISESEQIMRDFEEGNVRDCAMIIGAQKIEHYEMAAYGSLCELAEVMGKHQAAELLDETLEEEESADKMLTEVAEKVNDAALQEQEQY